MNPNAEIDPGERSGGRSHHHRLAPCLLGLGLALMGTPSPALEQLPDTPTLLANLGLSADEIAQIQAGKLVRHEIPAASERELTTAMAFQVPITPAQLEQDSSRDLLDHVDPNVIAVGEISMPATAADFSKLTLQPGAEDRAKAYASAQPGSDLNLSGQEIAAFRKLGPGATAAAVEAEIRAALLARVQAYQAQGLAGIAPYERGDGKQRAAGDELRTATKAAAALAKYAPTAQQFLLSYPKGKPPGTREIFRWSQFQAHGTPTIALTHLILIPDGDAWIAIQRQFYVSTGYNAEQGTAAFLPSKGGTVVAYTNHTSTDQVTGFGGGAKRSIGSRLLASQMESIFQKAAAEAR